VPQVGHGTVIDEPLAGDPEDADGQVAILSAHAALGHEWDLVVIAGNPAASIADVRRVETVFRNGVGYDPVKLIESVKGQVGLH